MKRTILLIHGLCTSDSKGKAHFDEIEKRVKGIKLKAYWFEASTQDEAIYKKEIDKAIKSSIAGKFDAVLLNGYFGDDNWPLGLTYALPKLVNNGIPVVVYSDSFKDNDKYASTASKILKNGRVCLINIDQLDALHEYIEGLFNTYENFSSIDYGFMYRDEALIEKREIIHKLFDKNAKVIGSKKIEVPLIAPIKNFLTDGNTPRPLSAKDSNKLFASVANDGTALSVRYEGTVLVAKWVANELREGKGEFFCNHYFQEMVRVEFAKELDENHFRSFFQAGIELFTVDKQQHRTNIENIIKFISDFIADVDPLLTINIRISHVNILNNLFDKYIPDDVMKFGDKCQEYDEKEQKRIAANNRFTKNKIVEIMEKGTMEDLSKILGSLPTSPFTTILKKLKAAQIECISVSKGIEILKDSGEYTNGDLKELLEIEHQCTQWRNCYFDPGIHRSLSFYSGITLQGDIVQMDGKIRKEVFGGGEFTGMVESFGYYKQSVYSFGLAFGVERLMNLLN